MSAPGPFPASSNARVVLLLPTAQRRSIRALFLFAHHGSILISVVAFGHSVVWWQWVGVACVFGGLSLSVQAKYSKKEGAEATGAGKASVIAAAAVGDRQEKKGS